MAQSPAYERVSLEQYLVAEESAAERHELFRGRIYSMAGGSSNHGEIFLSLHGICRERLKGKPCRILNDSLKVVLTEIDSAYYPDGAIACPPNFLDRRLGLYDNPTVIFEVLSPSTERFDRTRKFDDYSLLASLQDYVLIGSDVERVEVFSRQKDDSWALRVYLAKTAAFIPSARLDIPLEELYENAVFDDVPDPVHDPIR